MTQSDTYYAAHTHTHREKNLLERLIMPIDGPIDGQRSGAYAEFHFGRGWSIWRAVTRAYNGGLGRSPSGVQGQSPPPRVGDQGGEAPLKLKAFCCKTSKGSSKFGPFLGKYEQDVIIK